MKGWVGETEEWDGSLWLEDIDAPSYLIDVWRDTVKKANHGPLTALGPSLWRADNVINSQSFISNKPKRLRKLFGCGSIGQEMKTTDTLYGTYKCLMRTYMNDGKRDGHLSSNLNSPSVIKCFDIFGKNELAFVVEVYRGAGHK